MEQIKLGSRGLAVRILQYLLGFAPTGFFDSALATAVRNYQTAMGIEVDGIVGDETWGELAGHLAAQYRRPMLVGLRFVRAIQELVGLTGKDVDGKYGPVTEAAVAARQRAAGITVTGKVDHAMWNYLLTGIVPLLVTIIVPGDFKQYDPRWASKMYSRNNPKLTIRNNGCGPTAAADVIWRRWDKTATPETIADHAVKHGFCAEGSGTYRSFFAHIAALHGCRFLRTFSTAEVKKALLAGAYVVALMGPGFWTGGGHYITLYRYDPKTDLIYAHDPASAVRKRATAASFARERKEYFIFYREAA